jgi:hypothetical protein
VGELLSKTKWNIYQVGAKIEHSSVFGEGIYTCANPFAFHSYGNVGLMIAMIKGKISAYRNSSLAKTEPGIAIYNTIYGNKFHSMSMDPASVAIEVPQ